MGYSLHNEEFKRYLLKNVQHFVERHMSDVSQFFKFLIHSILIECLILCIKYFVIILCFCTKYMSGFKINDKVKIGASIGEEQNEFV